ncbi:MAG: VOC family protein [Candidatus Eisenbacteria bacterium]
MSHVPPGFSAVTPYLCLPDARGFLDFAVKALGATIRMDHRDESGALIHAEIEIEGAVLEVSEARPDVPATRTCLHLYVSDCDAVHARVVAAGGEASYPLADHPYGERSGGVQDAWGNHWFIATMTDLVKRTTTPND